MRLQLTDRLRVEAGPAGGRIVARVWVGDREIPAAPELLGAVGALLAGQRSDAVAGALARHGVLSPVDAEVAPIAQGPVVLRAALNLDLAAPEVVLTGPRG